jgi:hypothetical protein
MSINDMTPTSTSLVTGDGFALPLSARIATWILTPPGPLPYDFMRGRSDVIATTYAAIGSLSELLAAYVNAGQYQQSQPLWAFMLRKWMYDRLANGPSVSGIFVHRPSDLTILKVDFDHVLCVLPAHLDWRSSFPRHFISDRGFMRRMESAYEQVRLAVTMHGLPTCDSFGSLISLRCSV